MTGLLVEARRPIDPSADDGFEVSYVRGDGAEHRVPLAQAWAVPLEEGVPVRRFRSRKRQWHLSGLWWSATTGGHVGFESWLERDSLRPGHGRGQGRLRRPPGHPHRPRPAVALWPTRTCRPASRRTPR